MSKAYQLKIPLELVLSDSELSGNRIRISFELLRILAVERMRELLKKHLTGERNGIANPDGTIEVAIPGHARLIIDPKAETVEIDVAGLLPGSIDARVYDILVPPDLKVEAGGRIQLPASLTKEQLDQLLPSWAGRNVIDQEAARLRDEIRALLLKETVAARKALNGALKDVYRDAIKEKADQLGNVTGVSESSDGGTWRLRVEISK